MKFVGGIIGEPLDLFVKTADRKKSQFVAVEGQRDIVVVGLGRFEIGIAGADIHPRTVEGHFGRHLMVVRPRQGLRVGITDVDPSEGGVFGLHHGQPEFAFGPGDDGVAILRIGVAHIEHVKGRVF